MSARHAAKAIARACERGRAEVIIGAQAWAAVKLTGLFPNLAASLLSLVARALPKAGGIGAQSLPGSRSSGLIPSWLTLLDARAAARNNEL